MARPTAVSMLVVVANGGEQVRDVVVVEPVANVPTLALGHDEAKLPKDPELM